MTSLAAQLGKVSALWLDPKHPLRVETVQALQVSTGFNARQIETALTNCFEELSPEKIRAFVATFPAREQKPQDVLHILPSNVFTAWVHGAVTALLLEHRVYLKPSAREPVFAKAWKKSLETAAPSLARQVELVSWDESALKQYSTVVAYGSDETLQKIRTVLPKETRFAGYGHKLSVGIIFEEALGIAGSESLIEDVRKGADPFRLQGCLSPQILYVQHPHWNRWREIEMTLEVAPRVRTFAEWNALLKELGKFSPYLSCVGYAGDKDAALLAQDLEPYGVSRVCPMGDMQRPPLTWRNGGVDLINLLN